MYASLPPSHPRSRTALPRAAECAKLRPREERRPGALLGVTVKARVHFGVETKRVRETSPLEKLDAILKGAKKDLVRRGEELEPILDRVQDAEDDSTRVLMYARLEGRTVGFADAQLNTPGPRDLTIAQIAVHPRGRN